MKQKRFDGAGMLYPAQSSDVHRFQKSEKRKEQITQWVTQVTKGTNKEL
ncbi:MAG: hypothetical protein JWN25_3028 [Verrucomicrobiales bacterium]|nr:hypothetical protein [Verrucomicrobiales bacterium]